MRIFKKTPTFDFMAKRKIALAFSLMLIIASISSLAIKGLNFGLDFTGGTLIEVGYQQSADLNKIRGRLTTAGFGDAVVQTSAHQRMYWYVWLHVKIPVHNRWAIKFYLH